MSPEGQRIAIATCAHYDEFKTDDSLLREALARRGIEAPSVLWDGEQPDWSGFDACLIRSTWDYADSYDDFLAWTQSVAGQTQLWNPAELVAWNSNKTYLRELAEGGVPIVPTAWLQPGDEADVAALLESRGWDEVVMKPVVDLGARNLRRVAGEPAKAARALAKVLRRGEAMLQPFLPSLEAEGELSLIYVDGRFAHAVRKRPAPGDFRVQGIWGGTATPMEPNSEGLEIGALALSQLPEPPLYARVDLVEDLDGEPVLIELEMIEPSLYLSEQPDTADALAAAVAARLQR
jgi:glutathione synthase/RimK-type ligase-like ATP-grasp enzyme